MILAADIGGTRARLALFSDDGKRRGRSETFESRKFESVDAVVRAFLGPKPEKIAAAAVGIAGPVVDGRCSATNLPWVVEAKGLSGLLKTKKVALLNDLVALSHGVLTVSSSKISLIRGKAAPKRGGGNLAVVAAGTGLGQASLVWDGKKYVHVATEGGHVDFAPRSKLEFEILEFLQERYGRHVSYERVVSGPGLTNLYEFYRVTRAMTETKEIGQRIAKARDRNEEIVTLALEKRSLIAERAVDTFISLYGAETGNFALKTLAGGGGVFICGAVACALEGRLVEGGFVESFVSKGRMRPLLEAVPIALVKEPEVGLLGSAAFAASL